MYIARKRITLQEKTYEYIGRLSPEENAEEFKKGISKYISILKEFIESNFDRLTDVELYELLSKIYNISLDEKDYLKMLSKYNNKNYWFIDRMPTTMTYIGRATEGHGRSFDWWEQLYQVYYVVATSDTFKFDYNKVYSKEEIKKLASDKSIVLLKKEEKAINDNKDFNQEEFELIPTLDIDLKSYSNNISEFVLKNFHLFGDLLRANFSRSTVINDLKDMTEELSDEMKTIFSYEYSKSDDFSKTDRICKEWWNSSEEKKEYNSIQKVLRLR